VKPRNNQPKQRTTKKRKPRTEAQEHVFGSGNVNQDKSPELGREIARLRRDYTDIEESWKRVVRG